MYINLLDQKYILFIDIHQSSSYHFGCYKIIELH
jgi:hypothetical protein